MTSEYRKASTWRRIGILLAIGVVLVCLPGLIQMIKDPFTEDAPYPVEDFVFLRGQHRYRLWDGTNDGRIDCITRVPVLPWAKVRFYRDQPIAGCRGSGSRPMPEDMGRLADELLALRRRSGLSFSTVRDVDGDGRVDCVEYDGTWRYVEGAACPERLRGDAAPLSDDQRDAADRVLAIEAELNSRLRDGAR